MADTLPTLLLAEHDDVSLNPVTARALTAALALGAPVHVLVAGENARAAAEAAAKLDGVAEVLLADSPALAHRLAEPVAALAVALASGYGALVAPSTATGKSVMPRIAALLDAMQVSDVIAVVAPDIFDRPIYAGNAIQRVRATDATRVLTIRTASFAAAGEGNAAPIRALDAAAPTSGASFVSEEIAASARPDLSAARIIVSGGRALGSAENFHAIVEPLADALGAAVGASRAAVDAGYAPNDWQVGQTGKVVAPDLYVALGISGAIQHLAGMKDSKVIVAINKDEDAPIFQVADYGLVGDLFEIVPALQAEIAKAKA
ncbi:electron transfer flavoprotein alpha subunit apoprotein [Ancylobacter aquaticus]|uniref:Electron transfer flavoprotein subunit alpha n=1 Tax=Ancylobacter aquaticus TaxID=100 RepID=A0A4R1HR86_ANCAQ|nr:FAD-binding protein [Ancylobacter aquaticus]TCK23723.1 electron transfer flavoprotein alpha subunit apoprotein [Ancylobacter aquaticus]